MKYFVLAILSLMILGCSTEPAPLQYGTDVCHSCKMTLVDHKFGAELVTRKGKIYKFDDPRCFINYFNAAADVPADYEHALVVDYLTGKLINAYNAFYLKSAAIKSPMNGQVAAFDSKQSMTPLKRDWKAIYLGWGEMVTQYK